MKKDDIENKAKKAIGLVDGINKEFKVAAFSVIFEKILNAESNSDAVNDVHSSSPPKEGGLQKDDFEKRKMEFAKICSIDIKELDNIFYVKGDEIRLVSSLSGNETEKQVKASVCILLAYEILFEKTWLSSRVLSKSLDLSGVGNLTNLADTLKRNTDLVKKTGITRATEYKITGPGRTKAIEIIKKATKGEAV